MDQHTTGGGGNPEMRRLVSRLSEASLRINQSLDFDEVLQGVLDSARNLTNSDRGVMVLVDADGAVADVLATGLSPAETEMMWTRPQSWEVYQLLAGTPEAERIPDLTGYVHSRGFREWYAFPEPRTRPTTFMSVPLHLRGATLGHVFLSDKNSGEQFTKTDEDLVSMFAAQAALVISNARSHRIEKQARENVAFMAEASPTGVAIFDGRTGEPVWMNHEASRILDSLWSGDRVAGLLGGLVWLQPDGRETALTEAPLLKRLRAGEPVRGEEIALRDIDGKIVNILINANPVPSGDGRQESVLVVFQDTAPLERQEWLRADFLAMMSQGLRAPLAAIKGSITTLTESANDLGPVEMAQFFDIIRDQSDRMHLLIDDLSDMAHIQTGTLPLAAEPADVQTLVHEARARFHHGDAHNIVEVELEEGLPPVTADRRRILQVLSNLLSNTAQSLPHGLPILLTARRDADQVAILIAGKGQNASPEPTPEPFREYSREFGAVGPGFGLAICKGIVEAHGGRISAEAHGGRISAESDGQNLSVRFAFTLPAAEDPAAPPAPDTEPSRSAGPKPVRVMVVEDDPQALRYVQHVLTREGYAPITTSDPADVPRLIAYERPHLVLLDLVLSGSDGFELMNTIHKTADIPVIFMSAYGHDDNIAKALDMGAADYMVRPFSPTELAARIRAALRKPLTPFSDEPTEPYDTAGLRIDYARRRAAVDGQPVDLTATEYAVLYELAAHAPRVLTHNELLQRAWGPERVGEPWLLRDIVMRIRHKLGDNADNPSYIFTEPRVGYRMTTADDPETETGK